MASSIVGEARSTLDIDVAVRIDAERVSDLVAAVEQDYYVSEPMALDAIARRSSFNLVHFESGMKIDVFPLSDESLDARQVARRERVEVMVQDHRIDYDQLLADACPLGLEDLVRRALDDLDSLPPHGSARRHADEE